MKSKCQLTCAEMDSIVQSVKGELLSHKEAGKKHNVSPRLVHRLINDRKRHPSLPVIERKREEKRRFKLRVVIQHSLRHLGSKKGLLSSHHVQASILQEHGLYIERAYINTVLRHDIGARYKRIRKIPYLGNSVRCIALR